MLDNAFLTSRGFELFENVTKPVLESFESFDLITHHKLMMLNEDIPEM